MKRIRRVSDMMVTAHAFLKERYLIFSLISNTLLFSCAIILCVVTFADRDILSKYLSMRYNLYIGILAIISFVYSFIANQLEWKIKAEKHKSAFEKYMYLKFECNNILKRLENGENVDVDRFLEKYCTLTPAIISIPENCFLKCKRQHVLKVFISKHLDKHPGSSVLLLKIKIWIRDNFKSSKYLNKDK